MAELRAAVAVDREALAWWSTLALESPQADFAAAWLHLQASQMVRVRQAVLVLGDPDIGPFQPVAWLNDSDDQMLAGLLQDVVDQTLQTGSAAVLSKQPLVSVAYPLQVGGRLYGVAAFALAGQGPEVILQRLRWGMGVLESWVLQQADTVHQETADRLMQVVNCVAKALQQGRYQDVAMTLMTDLAVRLDCDRVSFGLRRSGRTRMQAMSHSTRMARDMNLMRCVAEAMDEAIDQHGTLHYPDDTQRPVQLHAHRQLARDFGNGHVVTVPWHPDERAQGAMTFERPDNKPFRAADIELCQSLALLVGRILYQRHQQERPLWQRWRDGLYRESGRLLGARHIGRKLLALLVLAVVVFGSLAHGIFRVHAPVVVQGVIQRSLTVPFDGYLSTAMHRAGDVVEQGTVLATLDTRDFELEALRINNMLVQYQKQADEAVAREDRAAAAIALAQAQQAQAQADFYSTQLSRAVVRAPFDGILVSGDLSQQLGEAVKRGQELFKISPMDDYQLWLNVDNRDIAQIREGQPGEVVLASRPNQPLPFSVLRVVPLAQVEDGKSVFRVEASMTQDHPVLLRPGMEGIGKVDIDDRRLIWIWTRGFTDWVRLQWWRWF